MILHILRAFFVLLMAAVGWSFIKDPHAVGNNTWLTVAIMICVSVALVCVDILAPRRKLAVFSGAFLGMIVGIAIAYALSFVTPLFVDQYEYYAASPLDSEFRRVVIGSANIALGLTACYLAISFIFQTKDDFRFIIPYVEFSKQTKGARQIVVDTSVLIDARIVDVAASGIIESQLVVPRFVIQELQLIADDSENKLRRNRGRRGLDALASLKNNDRISLVDYDPVGRHDSKLPVDEQLLALAKELNARLITNDTNLNKIAGLRGIDVINLNQLANAMKPVVLPGERMIVKLIKPGEEAGQGVGYLDDGTMVVVEQGRGFIGEEVEFTVTNMRQNTNGKMVFGRMGENSSPAVSRRTRTRPETSST